MNRYVSRHLTLRDNKKAGLSNLHVKAKSLLRSYYSSGKCFTCVKENIVNRLLICNPE